MCINMGSVLLPLSEAYIRMNITYDTNVITSSKIFDDDASVDLCWTLVVLVKDSKVRWEHS